MGAGGHGRGRCEGSPYLLRDDGLKIVAVPARIEDGPLEGARIEHQEKDHCPQQSIDMCQRVENAVHEGAPFYRTAIQGPLLRPSASPDAIPKRAAVGLDGPDDLMELHHAVTVCVPRKECDLEDFVEQIDASQ